MFALMLRRSAAFALTKRCNSIVKRKHEQILPGKVSRRTTGLLQPTLLSSAASLSSSASEAAESESVHSSQRWTNAIETKSLFEVRAPYEPTGDQPAAINHLIQSIVEQRNKHSVLCGCTGTGKTFAMAQVIARVGTMPALILCHNKTLAAQLARELASFFPNNAVELFVSYYNHFRPESYHEASQTYRSKKSSINADLDVLRHCATRSLLTRRDVVVVASVSCIFGLGMPREYIEASTILNVGDVVPDDWALTSLESNLLYTFNEQDHATFARGQYQTHDEEYVQVLKEGRQQQHHVVVTLWPPHEPFPMQVKLSPLPPHPCSSSSSTDSPSAQLFLQVTAIKQGTQGGFRPMDSVRIFPARHHVVSESCLQDACRAIKDELVHRVKELKGEGKEEQADRLQVRVTRDLEQLRETGYCAGLENYSRHLDGRSAGAPPSTLLDYFGHCLSSGGGGGGEIDEGDVDKENNNKNDWLLIVDESHVTLPQLKAMYAGDRSRKEMLVKHGFRLPSALDNRPLREDEFWSKVRQTLFVSATPGKEELRLLNGREPAEMVIRPTFVCDPVIEVRPTDGQLENLLQEVQARAAKNQRTLAVALTKRDAEDLASFLVERGVKSTFIHSGLKTMERSNALKALQSGEVDCLVGVNLLREGLDLPQVSLVAILGADSEGFLRGKTALLQTVGRAARNVDGTAILYANRVTEGMKQCMEDTAQRRKRQLEYNANLGCEMRTTEGSSTLSIFELLKDKIELQHSRDLSLQSPSLSHFPFDDADPKTLALKDSTTVETDHIPAVPGVYFWKGKDGAILYIGKANNLRSRVKSYLSRSTIHNIRIQTMIRKAKSVEFILTPSDRDALILESKLIKLHQPPFNVLLKDDEHYPYICASIGDSFPQLSIAARREVTMNEQNRRYRYFGPYARIKELKSMLQLIEEKYDLRAQSFQARHGSGSKTEYQKLFNRVLNEVFDGENSNELIKIRTDYESASQLFDSQFNRCRDVVAAAAIEGSSDSLVILVVQLRDGLVAGRFDYTCRVPYGSLSPDDYAAAIQTVLEQRHYPSGREPIGGKFSWFPDEVLLSHGLTEYESLSCSIVNARKEVEGSRKMTIKRISTGALKGERRIADARALEFALQNAEQVAREKATAAQQLRESFVSPSEAENSASELAEMLSLRDKPVRIECYDISHTQGLFPVGSCVVFINGKPARELYRKFYIQTVDGVDDYACLAEVLERRFRRTWVNGVGSLVDNTDPWALPDLVVIDGGQGQLGAAIKGMSKSRIFPHPVNGGSPAAYTKQRATVAVCALAKSNEDLYVYGRADPVNKCSDSPGLLLLRALRDESHRFALKSHRKRRSILRVGERPSRGLAAIRVD